MGRVFVKVCGITSVEDGQLAADAGADAVGFVFWPMSSRRVDAEKAARISRALPPFLTRVGVFVDASAAEMTRTADLVGLDILQLQGEESPETVAALPRRVIKAVRVGKGFTDEQALRYDAVAAGLLVDTRLPGHSLLPGGTGIPFDWALVRGLRERTAFLMLAGGLSPDNVSTALSTVRPNGVDVSTGVEALPGRKDPGKVRAFVKAVREWEQIQ
jgi:phosphoribosylanthranilate isomerase